MAIDKAAVRKFVREVRDIMNRDWDPIGGCPEDEYQSYAGHVAGMVLQGTTDEELLNYLEWAEVEHMGGARLDRRRAERVIAAVRGLNPSDPSN
jgi:hypothetical protein